MLNVHQILRIVFVALLFAVTGCESDATSQIGVEEGGIDINQFPNIGVINLDRLATTLGRNRELKQQIQQEQQELSALRDEFSKSIASEQELRTGIDSDEELTTEQNQERARKITELRLKEQQANQRLTLAHRQILNELAKDAGPYVQNVARNRNLLLVLKSGDYIIAAHQAIDITDAVGQQMTAAGALGSKESAPTDALGLPSTTPPETTPVPGASASQQDAPTTNEAESETNPADLFDFESLQDESGTSQP